LIMVDVNYAELIGVFRKYLPFLPKIPLVEPPSTEVKYS